MKKKVMILIVGILVSVFGYSQDLEITLVNKIYPLLSNKGDITLAASEYSGLYKEDIGLNLLEHPLNNGSYNRPEFLVLNYFINMKEGNMTELTKLYDQETAKNLNKLINISAAKEAYSEFIDFSLLSKAVFGDYVRLRYNMINAENQPIPWVLIARKIKNRYYLTENMPIEHLFVDVSSVNPYNYFREEFENINVSDMQSLYFSADGLNLLKAENDDFNNMGIYFRIDKFDTGPVGDEVELLSDMKQSLQDTADASFINLWDAENREKLNSSDFYKMQIEVQREFYNQIEKLEPLGVLNSGNEAVLFFKSFADDQELPLQLIPMKMENGSYKLTDRLESYYGWMILNEKDVLDAIEEYLEE